MLIFFKYSVNRVLYINYVCSKNTKYLFITDNLDILINVLECDVHNKQSFGILNFLTNA